jgi:hypothetical protein
MLVILPFLYLPFLCLVTVLIVKSVLRTGQEGQSNSSYFILLSAGILFTIIGPIIGFIRFDQYGDIPFDKRHVLSVMFFVAISSVFYWVAVFMRHNSGALLRMIVSGGLLLGIILCLFCSIHFLNYLHMGLIYPLFGFELLSPVMALLLLSSELYSYNLVQPLPEDLLPYRKELGFVPFPDKVIELPFLKRIPVYLCLSLLIALVAVLLCWIAGQDIDSIIKAFTHSRGFIFSN